MEIDSSKIFGISSIHAHVASVSCRLLCVCTRCIANDYLGRLFSRLFSRLSFLLLIVWYRMGSFESGLLGKKESGYSFGGGGTSDDGW